jgi:hypothetical protein
MTSESATECYVYITLPGQTAPVTAGRFTLTTDRRDIPLGRFVYGRRYLERPDAVPLDPLELKLSSRVYETNALKGVFGALRDAGPDYWGRRAGAPWQNQSRVLPLDQTRWVTGFGARSGAERGSGGMDSPQSAMAVPADCGFKSDV